MKLDEGTTIASCFETFQKMFLSQSTELSEIMSNVSFAFVTSVLNYFEMSWSTVV